MRVTNSNILDGYTQSSGTVASSVWNVQHFNGVSFAVTVSAQSSYGATAKLQVSNDMGSDGNGTGVTTWIDLPNTGSSANIALAANGGYLWNLDGVFYKWARVFVTWSAGSAVLNIRANGKGPSAQ